MRLEPAKSFKKRAMGDGTRGLFILGPSEIHGMAFFYFSPDAWTGKE